MPTALEVKKACEALDAQMEAEREEREVEEARVVTERAR